MTLLKVEGLTKKFGGLVANSNVTFSIEKGEILGIVGPNGAGKTTLFNGISGVYKIDSGKVIFNGEDVTNMPSYELCKKGIGRTFQIPMSLDGMTVLDNVTVGAMVRDSDVTNARRDAMEVLRFSGLAEFAYKMVGSLSVIQKKRLEIARALATKPQLLLLDECMAGLHGAERNRAVDFIREINRMGVTILTIEHVMQVVMNVSNRVVVLLYGEKIAEGTPQEVTNNETVISAYLGG